MLNEPGTRRAVAFLWLLSSLGVAAHAADSPAIRTTRVGFGRHDPKPDTSAIAVFFVTEPPREKHKKIARIEFTPAYYRNLDTRIRDGGVMFTAVHREHFEALAAAGQAWIIARAMIDAKLASKNQPMADVRVRAESLATHREWLDDTSLVAEKLRRQVLPRIQEIEDALSEARRVGGDALLINDKPTPMAKGGRDPLFPDMFPNAVQPMVTKDVPMTQGIPVFDAWVVVRK